MSAKVGTLTVPTSTGNQSITGLGFSPQLVFFFGTRQTADGYAGEANVALGAFTSSSDMFTLSTMSKDNVAASATNRTRRVNRNSTFCIEVTDETGTLVGAAPISLDSDGFTINWTTAGVGKDYKIRYLALEGLTNANILTIAPNGSAGNQSFTGAGFRPDAVLVFGTKDAVNTGSVGYAAFLGAMISAASQGSASFRSVEANPTKDSRWQATGNGGGLAHCYLEITSVPDAGGNATLASMDADGFTVTWAAGGADSGTNIHALCLKGGSWATSWEEQKTSSGTKATTGTGFQPEAVLFFGYNDITHASSIQTASDSRLVVGATDGTNDATVWVEDVVAVATTEANSRTVAGKCITHSASPSTTQAEASISSLDADGFTLNWTTADATAREFVYLAFKGAGAAAAAGDNPPIGILGRGAGW